jgi:esterase/lipase
VFNGKWMFDVSPQQFVKSIKCPTLVQWGMQDELVPQHSIHNIVNNITAKKKFEIYQQSAHESFAKKENEKWKQTVSDFLNQP